MVGITTPYQIHHGDSDRVVPLAMDKRFATRLASRGRRHELPVYPGGTHNVPSSRQMYDRVRRGYRSHRVLAP